MNKKIFDTDFLKKLDTIMLNARMLMNEGSGGNRKSKSKGSSVEFSDFREYTLGDDFRRIDWNAYGRFDRLFVKLFMEEREALVNIFIDGSKSMDYGNPKKSELSLKIAGVFAFLALNNLDRVCINALKLGHLKSSTHVTGRAMFDRCISFLEGVDFSGETDLNASIKKKEFKSRGVSILISDFFSPGGVEEAVKYLMYKKQDVILIHVLSPEELNPELEGQMRLVDSETGKAIEAAISPMLLKQYHKELNHFTNGLREFCVRMGASYVQISSGEAIEKVVFEDFTRAGVIG